MKKVNMSIPTFHTVNYTRFQRLTHARKNWTTWSYIKSRSHGFIQKSLSISLVFDTFHRS